MQSSAFQFFTHTEETWTAMLEALCGAKISVDIEHYIFLPDSLGQEFIKIIRERNGAGVKVRLLLDTVGSYALYNSSVPAQLESEGIEIQFFNTVGFWRIPYFATWFFRDHKKMIIIDGKVGFTGGTGINKSMATWRDTDAKIEGPIVGEMLEIFEDMWKAKGDNIFQRIKKIRARTKKRFFITNIPYFRKRFLYYALIKAIKRSTKSIWLTTPYVIPDHKLSRVLRRASRRGVEVKIIVPKIIDVAVVGYASNSSFGELLKAGVRIFKYQPVILHAKTAIIDTEWATFGSFNLDSLSFVYNFEGNVVSTDSKCVGALSAHFAEDLKNCEEVLYKNWVHRPFLEKLKEFFIAPIRGFL